MKYLSWIFAFLLIAACADDDQVMPSIECGDEGAIRIRIQNASDSDLTNFSLEQSLGDNAVATVYNDLPAGATTAYCSFSGADRCSFIASAIDFDEVLFHYDAQCIIADPLAAGDYTLRFSCTGSDCSLTYLED